MKTPLRWMITILALLCAINVNASMNVLACEPEWAALAQELGGDKLTIVSATTAAQDPHHIQARPSLIAKTRRAALLICSGAGLETGWLPLLLRKAGNPAILPGKPGHFMTTDFVPLRDKPLRVDRSEGDVHSAGNPHIHTSAPNIALVAAQLTRRLQQLDSDNKAYYQRRYNQFEQRWQAAIVRWQQQAQPLRGKPVVVQHRSWTYLSHWLGLNEVIALEEKPGIPATSKHLTRVLEHMQAQPAALIIYAAYQDSKPSRWLADKTQIPAVALPFTVGGTKNTDDLFALFDQTIALLIAALK